MRVNNYLSVCLFQLKVDLDCDSKKEFLIEIDGGINLQNVKTVTDAGVELVVAGSSVFGAVDIPARVKEFLEIL